MPDIKVRKEMPDVALTREQFTQRIREQFYDPAFDPLSPEIDRIIGVAWDGYDQGHKAPRTQKAGPGYADPNYNLSVERIGTSGRIKDEKHRTKEPAPPSPILLINSPAPVELH